MWSSKWKQQIMENQHDMLSCNYINQLTPVIAQYSTAQQEPSVVRQDGDHHRYKTREHTSIHTFNFYFNHHKIHFLRAPCEEIWEVFISHKYVAYIFESHKVRFPEPSKIANSAKCGWLFPNGILLLYFSWLPVTFCIFT